MRRLEASGHDDAQETGGTAVAREAAEPPARRSHADMIGLCEPQEMTERARKAAYQGKEVVVTSLLDSLSPVGRLSEKNILLG